MWQNIKRIFRKQQGFTAVEVLIGIAIIGIIGSAIATSVAQTITGSNTSNNQMTAINNVRNAIDWITRDAQMARVKESVIGSGALGASPDEIKLIWYEYYPTYPTKKWYRVIYTINGTELYRAEDVGVLDINGVWTSTTAGSPIIVAQNITGVTRQFTECIWSGTPAICVQEVNSVSITVSSTVGSGPYQASESRTIEIRMRPSK